jgi:hypothetical protein
MGVSAQLSSATWWNIRNGRYAQVADGGFWPLLLVESSAAGIF